MASTLPYSNCAVYNPIKWGQYLDYLIKSNATFAGFTVTFDSGGTAADGTIITIAGVQFEVLNAWTPTGYYFDWNTLTDIQRATSVYSAMVQNINFSPDIVTILQLGNAIGVVYNKAGLQSNWAFNDGGITEISFFESNGVDFVLRDVNYVHNILEDRSSLSLPPSNLTNYKQTPVLYSVGLDGIAAELETFFDYSEDLRNSVSTSLPNIYTTVLSPYLDPLFTKKVFLRIGIIEKVNCTSRSNAFEDTATITIYNSLFQKALNDGSDLMQPYVVQGKPFLIKDTYEICKNQSFYIWVHSGTSPSIVYYDANDAPIESGTFDLDVEGVNIVNVGTDVLELPTNCAYYIIVFGNEEQYPIRFNVTDCCGVAEFIALCDLGEYEVFPFDELQVKTDERTSDTVNTKSKGTVQGLISGGASVTNTNASPLRVYTKTLEYNKQDAEYWAQFKRSSSFAMKIFNPTADAFFWQKIVPVSIEFNEQEKDNYIEIKFTFNENQIYLNNEQNDSYPL